jgi:hypothetical protein
MWEMDRTKTGQGSPRKTVNLAKCGVWGEYQGEVHVGHTTEIVDCRFRQEFVCRSLLPEA